MNPSAWRPETRPKHGETFADSQFEFPDSRFRSLCAVSFLERLWSICALRKNPPAGPVICADALYVLPLFLWEQSTWSLIEICPSIQTSVSLQKFHVCLFRLLV